MTCRDLLARVSVSDVMKPCSTFINSRDLITKARSIMRSTGIRTLPVIDGGRLEGIVTAREIMRVTSTRSNIPVVGVMSPYQLITTPSSDLATLANEMVGFEISDVPVVQSHSDRTVVGLVKLDDILSLISGKISSNLLVGDVMTKNVVTCEQDDEISRVWNIMEYNRYSGLPVVRYDKRKRAHEVIGMITRADLIRSGAIRLGEESEKGRFRSQPRVKSLMRTPAIVATPKMSITKAIDLMIERNVGRLPVVDDGKLVGIISRSDIIRVACR